MASAEISMKDALGQFVYICDAGQRDIVICMYIYDLISKF